MRKTIEIVTREYLTEAEDGCTGYAETHRTIVLCEDCKYCTPQPDTSQACCDLTYSGVEPHDFCSYGERKETK